MDPIQWFLKHVTSGGVLLIFVTFLALLWANSPMKEYYKSLWEYDFILGLEPFELKKSLLHWINDGMMAIFFFVVGLEIKREFIAGELSSFRQAIFPVFGAFGGMFVRMRPKININEFIPKIKEGLKHFSSLPKGDQKYVMSNRQLAAIDHMETMVKKTQSPLQMIEHNLSGVVNYLILPLFALANAGVTIFAPGSPLSSGAILNDLSIAIAVSLVFGKAIGISLFSWLAVKLKLSVKPRNIPWKAFIGLGFIGGIGFTMSLFISSLAFKTPELMSQAKIGIFFGSIAAGLIGFFILKSALNKKSA
jgi:Na+/H+ antiporter NhaA